MNGPSPGKVSMGRVYLFSFAAYAASIVDDAPFNADQLLGAANQLEMEVILHVTTLAFLALAVREAGRGRIAPWAGFLTLVAFVVASLDDFPSLRVIRYLRHHHWYLLDISIHLASIIVFYFAVRRALRESEAAARPGVPSQPA
ncbi:MAG TPA: hypothetical protein VLX56_05845 [Nitrososphaerales archaeon]|nr:hypothetical protein [Nitrososphaerales archaeon]